MINSLRQLSKIGQQLKCFEKWLTASVAMSVFVAAETCVSPLTCHFLRA
jgi:hypothetical protein